jgi:hypothetical protein
MKLEYQVLKRKRSVIVRNEPGSMRRTDNRPVIPVVPTHGKRECRVNEALSQFDVTTGYRQESDLRK